MRFEPVDLLTVAFAGLLALLGVVSWDSVGEKSVVLRMLLVAAAPCAVAFVRARVPKPGRALGIVMDFYVVVCIVAIFDGLGPLIRAVHPVDRDAWLIAFDRALFGADPTVVLERFATPLLSDVLTVFYGLYYFHPIVLGGLVFRDDLRNGTRAFRDLAFTLVLVFYVSYVGYFLVPAIGPRFTLTHAGPLPRGQVSRAIDDTLDKLERNKRDCFPSGHTMVVAAVLIEAGRRSRKTFWGFVPFAIGLVAATVYGRYHYVADVLAGLLLAFATVPLARWLTSRSPSRSKIAACDPAL